MVQTYFFDAILVTSSLPLPRLTATSVTAGGNHVYSIRVFNDFEELPMERLFVEEFPPYPLVQFTASPCDLIGSLTTRGVCVGLKQNDEMLGMGNFKVGAGILRQLTEPSFLVTQSVMVDLVMDKKVVGVVELIIKLSSSDPDINHGLLPFGCYDVCRPVEKSINKKDIIFTLGRSEKCATNTCITDERLMSHAGAPFQCPHVQAKGKDTEGGGGGAGQSCGCYVAGMQLPKDVNTEKKREKATLRKLIDELNLDKIKVPTPPCSHQQSRQWHCKCSQPPESTSTDTSSSDPGPLSKRAARKRKALSLTASREQQTRRKILGKCPASQPNLLSVPYKPPTLCQLCQSDISWLPKVSACPYCGYKNFDDIPPSEEEYDLTATAQQLLRDCLRKEKCKNSSSEEDKDDLVAARQLGNQEDPNLPKTCGCMGGKPCTRCRIRKLCDNFFKEGECKAQILPQAQAQASPVTKVEMVPKKTPSTTSQRQQQLISIFTEMRNMYSRKKGASEEEAQAEKQKKECDAACYNTKSAKARRKARRSLAKALKEIDLAYPKPPKMSSRKKKHRPRSKYYTFLKSKPRAPKPRIGHVDCITDSSYTGYCKVPCNMGWMWTKCEMARYKSWRPGAISKPIRQMMAYFLKDYPLDNLCLSRYHYRRRRCEPKDPEEELVQHPTLHISRKGDEYIITLRPLKDPRSLAVSANPYANMKPVVFRITKDPMAAALREMKVSLQEKGFAPCSCGRPVASCFCRSHIDKKRIQYELEKLCQQRGWQDNSDTFVYSTNSDDDESENEYEFGVTPPAGVIKPERNCRPDRAHAETQYMDTDWAAPNMFPHPASMLVQFDSCAMGERKNFFPWLFGKGNIHAPPKKPKMRNKPKKKERIPLGGHRAKGGFVDPQYFNNPTPLNRPWHKSNYPENVKMY
ncbi:uncharacterized protein [Drosophila bipectinata]|uniref:uncharacterized protein n=1 Tax=Drosophila bipectinata TaxID=42026 RepID=UPI001C88F557|nr:uncharacterized protein LOC108122246 [Drosophila bipectinata]